MKNYRSSILRPIGSLANGLFWTSLVIALLLGFVALTRVPVGQGLKHLRVKEAARQPAFRIPASLILVIGGWATLSKFLNSRGTYRVGPMELEASNGLLWKHVETIRYEDISRIDHSRGPLMGLLGTSDLKIIARSVPPIPSAEGCSTIYPFTQFVTLYGISNAEEFRRYLLERRDSLRELRQSEQPSLKDTLDRLTKAIDRIEKRPS